jgi:hypothetical protein
VQLGWAWKPKKSAPIPVASALPRKTATIAARIAKARRRRQTLSVAVATLRAQTRLQANVSDHISTIGQGCTPQILHGEQLFARFLHLNPLSVASKVAWIYN